MPVGIATSVTKTTKANKISSGFHSFALPRELPRTLNFIIADAVNNLDKTTQCIGMCLLSVHFWMIKARS
jgi:hypothetical protein